MYLANCWVNFFWEKAELIEFFYRAE